MAHHTTRTYASSELRLDLGLTLWGNDAAASHSDSGLSNSEQRSPPATTDKVQAASSAAVGWPPVRSYRRNFLGSMSKSDDDYDDGDDDEMEEQQEEEHEMRNQGRMGSYVKVYMDGVGIGRKLDLSAFSSYQSLARAVEIMFQTNSENAGDCVRLGSPGCAEYVLTYEDSEGDWMLVGDVPWMMFVQTAKRLRIMKTSHSQPPSHLFAKKKRIS